MKIEDIRRPKGANRRHKRVGRGQGSGLGKTSGRGSKGVKARSGGAMRVGFEGGQMPLMRRIPKRGFTNVVKLVNQVVNIEGLNHFKKDSHVNKDSLKKAGLIKSVDAPVKVLGNGKIAKALTVSVDAFSKSARKKISDAGGKVEVITKGKK
jgi:large subunit ribosomal protein L15